jgi:hypothetical protein
MENSHSSEGAYSAAHEIYRIQLFSTVLIERATSLHAEPDGPFSFISSSTLCSHLRLGDVSLDSFFRVFLCADETIILKQILNTVTYRLRTRRSEREETAVARERLGKHIPASTDTHAIEEVSEAVFSMRPVPFYEVRSEAIWEGRLD